MDLFECKINYLSQLENGSIARKNEVYLVDAMSFTEAEARLQGELESLIPEYTVVAMKRSNVDAFTVDQAKEKFFKCKISYIANDPDSGKEKKVKEYILVQADDFDDATGKVDARMEGTISDFEIDSISKTPIVDIIQRNA